MAEAEQRAAEHNLRAEKLKTIDATREGAGRIFLSSISYQGLLYDRAEVVNRVQGLERSLRLTEIDSSLGAARAKRRYAAFPERNRVGAI